MFDIGFSEIVVIAVVALVVIGPERLPKTARTLGHLFGRLQRYVNDVKADINREMELDELRKLQRDVQTAATDLKSSIESVGREVESSVHEVGRSLNEAANEAAPATDPEVRRLAESGPLFNEPGGELADATPASPPRQASLPGFDKI
ncbi:MAG: twin-arginine translocase subunit TatB [Burkholderiales bacterium]|nr:twin-arginine translocase subunit TatB [Burkholderiales bacterium]